MAPVAVVELREYPLTSLYEAKTGGVQRADVLLQVAATANAEPLVGKAAEEWLRGKDFLSELVRGLKPEHLGALGFRMLGAETLDESMEHLSSGFELVTNSGRWQQHRGREQVTYVWQRTATTAGQSRFG